MWLWSSVTLRAGKVSFGLLCKVSSSLAYSRELLQVESCVCSACIEKQGVKQGNFLPNLLSSPPLVEACYHILLRMSIKFHAVDWEFLAGWLQKAFLCFAGGGTALCVTSLGCHKCHRSTVQEQECNHLTVCLLVFPGHVLRNGGSRWVLFQAISVQGCWARFPASGTSAVLPAGMKPWCEKPSVPGALERLCWIHCSYKHSVIRFFRTKGEI